MADRRALELAGILNLFFQRYLEDRNSGRPTPLKKYQRAFPGYEELIAEHYGDLAAEVASPDAETVLGALPPPGAPPPDAPGPPPDPRPLEAGVPARIGPYRVLSVLGEGGMGTVVLAEQTQPIHRRIAIKLIKLGMASREVVARFEGERTALALMNHSNIARVFDAGLAESGQPYFAMEYVAGPPLDEYCDRQRLTIDERLQLFLSICNGVQHAHQKGVIHRDLKASNIFVSTEDDQAIPKIIDFGIAKSLNRPFTEQTVFTESGQMIGTPEYMSPEQADPGATDIDTRADIYSLGVVLYHLLVGSLPRGPLRGLDFEEMRRRIRSETPPPRPSVRLGENRKGLDTLARLRRTTGRALIARVRGDLDWIVMRALERDRARRYASASELAADVQRHLDLEPVLARPPRLSYQLARLVRRRRVEFSVAAAIAALVILTATVAVVWIQAARQGEAARWLETGQERLALQAGLEQEVERLEAQLEETKATTPAWLPVWEQKETGRLRDELEAARRSLDRQRLEAMLGFARAREVARIGSQVFLDATGALTTLHWEDYLRARSWGSLRVSSDYFLSQAAMLGTELTPREEERLRFVLRTEPPGAEVLCFRYETHEEHRIPIPFSASEGRHEVSRGRLAEPFLLVERVWHLRDDRLEDLADERRDQIYPFAPGDRLIEVNDRRVALRGDLAAALENLAQDASVRVLLIREGEERELSWVPFPAELYAAQEPEDKASPILDDPLRPGRLLDIRRQLDLSFAGYPLEFPAPIEAAATIEPAADGSHAIDLPGGSYLLLIRREGHPDVRLPVSSPWEPSDVTVELYEEPDIPPGFVYIPAGQISPGGDREVDQSLKPETRFVQGFFMKRLEVSFREYLDFLNDPENRLQIDPTSGTASAQAPWPAWLRNLASRSSIGLVPSDPRGGLYFRHDGSRWQAKWPDLWLDLPMIGLPMVAGLEYVDWLNRKHRGRWTFRLPTDLEWEKAARGVDGRSCVWGDHVVPAFCNSLLGHWGKAPLALGGSFPLDESVYGVRDLAGSLEEPVAAVVDQRFVAYRGGSYSVGTQYNFRIANRNGRYPWSNVVDGGLRVVAELPGKERP